MCVCVCTFMGVTITYTSRGMTHSTRKDEKNKPYRFSKNKTIDLRRIVVVTVYLNPGRRISTRGWRGERSDGRKRRENELAAVRRDTVTLARRERFCRRPCTAFFLHSRGHRTLSNATIGDSHRTFRCRRLFRRVR